MSVLDLLFGFGGSRGGGLFSGLDLYGTGASGCCLDLICCLGFVGVGCTSDCFLDLICCLGFVGVGCTSGGLVGVRLGVWGVWWRR